MINMKRREWYWKESLKILRWRVVGGMEVNGNNCEREENEWRDPW